MLKFSTSTNCEFRTLSSGSRVCGCQSAFLPRPSLPYLPFVHAARTDSKSWIMALQLDLVWMVACASEASYTLQQWCTFCRGSPRVHVLWCGRYAMELPDDLCAQANRARPYKTCGWRYHVPAGGAGRQMLHVMDTDGVHMGRSLQPSATLVTKTSVLVALFVSPTVL